MMTSNGMKYDINSSEWFIPTIFWSASNSCLVVLQYFLVRQGVLLSFVEDFAEGNILDNGIVMKIELQ